MIPKIIHYCWLSGEQMPENLIRCMDTWKELLPEYEMVLWDMEKFDISSNAFVNEACSVKKWAFAADYIRIFALYTEGGIYLDTDVLIKKRFDDFLGCDFFTSVEYHPSTIAKNNSLSLLSEGKKISPDSHIVGIGIQAAILGGIKGHPFLKDCLDWYQNRRFILENGEFNNTFIAPDIYAGIAENYGFRYTDEHQDLSENMQIYPSEIFAGSITEATENSYAVHCGAGSWREKPKEGLLKDILNKIKKNPTVRKMLGKKYPVF